MSMSGSVGAGIPRNHELKPLYEPLTLGNLELSNRLVMAPMTRNRADDDGVPADFSAEYYAQRAGAGLIVSEGVQISEMGKGYDNTPGIHSDAQIAAWKKITDAVHKEGGKIFLQLWHVGRVSVTGLLPEGRKPLAPSAIRADCQTFANGGMVDVDEPEAMSTDQIRQTVEDFAQAAKNAITAGFDGVEIHGANGYLIDQFVRTCSNRRADDYGGSPQNRARFLKEVTEAVVRAVGGNKTGLRLSPTNGYNDMSDKNPEETFAAAIDAIKGYGLCYLHFVENMSGERHPDEIAMLHRLADRFDGVYIANGGFDGKEAAEWIAEDKCQAVSFGKPYIANPDLATRWALGADLNEGDESTYYGGGREGYTDYEPLSEEMRKKMEDV